jgi:hypothetical protein
LSNGLRDRIAWPPVPDYGPVDIPPDEHDGASADPEDADAERLLYQMASDGNAIDGTAHAGRLWMS